MKISNNYYNNYNKDKYTQKEDSQPNQSNIHHLNSYDTNYNDRVSKSNFSSNNTPPPQHRGESYYQNWAYNKHLYNKNQDQNIGKPKLLEFFGIFPEVPSFNILKLCTVIILVVLIELNIFINLNGENFLGEEIDVVPNVLIGVGIIGIFFGLLHRSIYFELEELRWFNEHQEFISTRPYFTLAFLLILTIFIIIEVIVELLFTRGILFLVDMLSILSVTFGTIAIFSGKRHLNIITMIFLFMIMLLGMDYNSNLPILVFLGIFTLIYLELSDGVCRLQEQIQKFHLMTEGIHPRNRVQVNYQLNGLTFKFLYNVGIFITLTILIISLFLGLYVSYPSIVPRYIGENLELQTVYAILPIFVLLFSMFIIIYTLTPRAKSQENTEGEY